VKIISYHFIKFICS